MCLLIMQFHVHGGLPLVVAANRDELYDRPAEPMTILRAASPRVLGGRDESAGGTWLAVNQYGVVAALTNRPTPGGRDLTKRSRGELPLALAQHDSAAAAVDAFTAIVRPSDYNPAWLLVGDRQSAFAVDMTGEVTLVEPLPPGIHILENRPLGAKSAKVDRVRMLVDAIDAAGADELVHRLHRVLADHEVPAADDVGEFPPEIKAACVHTERYGTRWSGVITVSDDPAVAPAIRYTDGPPCRSALNDADVFWGEGPDYA